MRRGGWITHLGCMAPFIAAGLWLGLQIEVPTSVRAAVDGLIGRDRLYPVLVDGKVGYIDRSGRLVLPACYEPTGGIGIDAITCPTPPPGMEYWQNRRVTWGRDFREGRAAVLADLGWQMIDCSGRELLDKPVGELGEFQHGLCLFSVGGLYGLLDRDGNIRVPAKQLTAPQFDGGVWISKYLGYSCIYDTQGRRLTRKAYRSISPPHEGMLRVSRNGKFGFIDIWGREVIRCRFDRAGHFYDGCAPVNTRTKKTWRIDKAGRAVIEPAFRQEPAYEYHLTPVTKGGLVGLKDSKGQWVVQPVYKRIGPFDCSGANDGLPVSRGLKPAAPTAPVSLGESLAAKWDRIATGLESIEKPPPPRLAIVQTADGKWGILDAEGELRCKRLDWLIVVWGGLRFSEGLARVTRGGKVGFVDRTGKMVIEPQFDYAEDFSGGLSRIIMGITHRELYGLLTDVETARWGYVDRAGRIVWKPTR